MGQILTKSLSFKNRLGSILTGGIEHGDHTQQLPRLIVLLHSDAQRPETTARKLLGLLVVQVTLSSRDVSNLDNGPRSALGTNVPVASETTLSRDTLRDGVKGREFVGAPALAKNLARLGVALQGQDGDLIDGIEGLDVMRTGQGCDSHHPVDVLAFGNIWLANTELVCCQGTGLIGAEHVHTLLK